MAARSRDAVTRAQRRPAASAVVLAGGRSTRFGVDKLATLLGGRPLLDYAVLAAAAVARDVVVVGSAGPARLPSAPGVTILRVPDTDPFAGPLVALATGLALVREPIAIVVAGDMPTMVPDVLSALVAAIEASDGVEASALLQRGRREPLPMALRAGVAASAAGRAVASGERSLHALLEALHVRDIHETEWRRLDPAADTPRDVDRPSDLPR